MIVYQNLPGSSFAACVVSFFCVVVSFFARPIARLPRRRASDTDRAAAATVTATGRHGGVIAAAEARPRAGIVHAGPAPSGGAWPQVDAGVP